VKRGTLRLLSQFVMSVWPTLRTVQTSPKDILIQLSIDSSPHWLWNATSG